MGGLFSGGGITILNFFLLLLFGVTLENPYVLITEALQIAGRIRTGFPAFHAFSGSICGFCVTVMYLRTTDRLSVPAERRSFLAAMSAPLAGI